MIDTRNLASYHEVLCCGVNVCSLYYREVETKPSHLHSNGFLWVPETEDNGKVAHVEGRAVWIAGREGGADLRGCFFCPFCPDFAKVHLGKSRGTPVYPGYGVEKRWPTWPIIICNYWGHLWHSVTLYKHKTATSVIHNRFEEWIQSLSRGDECIGYWDASLLRAVLSMLI